MPGKQNKEKKKTGKKNNAEKILPLVLAKVTPDPKEFEAESRKAREIIKQIMSIKGSHVKAELGGSLSRNTHLKGDRDIDIFVFYPAELDRKSFEKESLALGKKAFRGKQFEIAYAEHPYARGVMDGYDVEIVPSYCIEDTSALKSSVDRSSFHTRYLKKRLSESHRKGTRLLKAFLKGINAYGADTRQTSFSGYLCELLVLNFGSFEGVLESARQWGLGTAIDIEFGRFEAELGKMFPCSALIVVDPTDKNRNVAAAVSKNQFARFVAASREYLKSPSLDFFFPKKPKPLPPKKVRFHCLEEDLVVFKAPYPKGVFSDTAWGQFKRIAKKLSSSLEQHGFTVYRAEAWTDEKKLVFFFFDLEANELERTVLVRGPEVFMEAPSARFLEKHKKPVFGPRIVDGRWVVGEERKEPCARNLIKKLFWAFSAHESAKIKRTMRSARMLSESQVVSDYKKHAGFREEFTLFLEGKEAFM